MKQKKQEKDHIFNEVGRQYRWKKGKSGCPAGRPRGVTSLSKILRDQLDDPASSNQQTTKRALQMGLDPEHTTIAAVLTQATIQEALEGKGSLIKEIFSRIDDYLGRGLTKTQVVSLAEAIGDIINDEIRDPVTRSRIAERIALVIEDVDSLEWRKVNPID